MTTMAILENDCIQNVSVSLNYRLLMAIFLSREGKTYIVRCDMKVK